MDENLNIDDLQLEIEEQFQKFCNLSRIGGAATLDELADVVDNMAHLIGNVSKIVKIVNDLSSAVFNMQDEIKLLKSKS